MKNLPMICQYTLVLDTLNHRTFIIQEKEYCIDPQARRLKYSPVYKRTSLRCCAIMEGNAIIDKAHEETSDGVGEDDVRDVLSQIC